MRAVVFDQPGDESVLVLRDVPAPPLGPLEVRIRVSATSVNRADLLQRRGMYNPPRGASPILGLECAGAVVEVGAEVTGFRPGERVMALLTGGGYAEEVVTPAATVLHVPPTFTDEDAGSFMEVFLTAFSNLFWLGAVKGGDAVLVHGGGSGVGTAAILLCKASGVRTYVTAGSEEKCRRCIELGAAGAFNYRTQDFVAEVRRSTAGAGVAAVLDAIGGPYLERNLACLATEGALLLIGVSGGTRTEVELAPLLQKRLRILGTTLRGRDVAVKAEIIAAFRARFPAPPRPVIHTVLPLERVAEAHRLMQAGTHFGKIALRVSP